MIRFAREAPSPIPVIHPVPEFLAEGELHNAYEDMKSVFQVPWMGVVTMAYAHYGRFFDVLWEGLRPLCLSVPFVDGFTEIRKLTEERVAALEPPDIRARLESMGYAAREIGQIRDLVEIFSHGNYPYLLIATLTRYLLEGGELGEEDQAAISRGRHAPKISVPFVLMESHHADDATRAVYADVMATLDLPFVNTDYRAMARWPSYFRAAWNDLKPRIGTDPYAQIVLAVHERAFEVVQALPNVGEIDPAELKAAANESASDPDEVAAVCRLFQWLLPGLVTHVAFFRAQLRES